MSTKLLVSLCAAFALLAACKPKESTAPPPDTTTAPPADTTAPPPPADTTTPPPADTTGGVNPP